MWAIASMAMSRRRCQWQRQDQDAESGQRVAPQQCDKQPGGYQKVCVNFKMIMVMVLICSNMFQWYPNSRSNVFNDIGWISSHQCDHHRNRTGSNWISWKYLSENHQQCWIHGKQHWSLKHHGTAFRGSHFAGDKAPNDHLRIDGPLRFSHQLANQQICQALVRGSQTLKDHLDISRPSTQSLQKTNLKVPVEIEYPFPKHLSLLGSARLVIFAAKLLAFKAPSKAMPMPSRTWNHGSRCPKAGYNASDWPRHLLLPCGRHPTQAPLSNEAAAHRCTECSTNSRSWKWLPQGERCQ